MPGSLTKSKIFLLILVVFVFGVMVRSFFPVPYLALAGLFILAGILAAFGLRPQKRILVIFAALLISAIAGVVRFDFADNTRPDLSLVYGKTIYAEGIVWNEPQESANSQLLDVKVTHGQVGSILIRVVTRKYPEYFIGEKIKLQGKVERPESLGEFDYAAYLAKDGIFATMSFPDIEKLGMGDKRKIQIFLSKIKHAFEAGVDLALPEPHASFMKGLLLGERQNLSADFIEQLKITGTTHIVALSGYNISIIARGLIYLLLLLTVPFRWSFWVASSAIVGFVFLTGASSSVVRAGIMGILVLIATREGRLYRITNALGFAAAAMVFYNPKILRFDAAFQLSFLATAGLVYLSPLIEPHVSRLTRSFKKKSLAPNKYLLEQILTETIAAQLMVLPLIIFLFGRVSLISPVANVLVLLAVPYAMFAGFAAGLAAIIWAPLGRIAGAGAWVLLEYMMRVIELLSRAPGASFQTGIWGSIAGLGIVVFLLLKSKKR